MIFFVMVLREDGQRFCQSIDKERSLSQSLIKQVTTNSNLVDKTNFVVN